MKKYGRGELSKKNKNDLINIIIELQENIVLTKDMINREGRPKIEVTNEMKKTIIELRKEGKGTRYIAEAVGMSHTKVAQLLKTMI